VPSLGIPNFSTPLSTPRTNDSAAEVLEYSSERASTAPRESSGKSVSEFEGVAATAKVRGTGSPSGASSQSPSARSGASGAGASAETKRALAAIGDASANGAGSGDAADSDSGSRSSSAVGTAGDTSRAKASGSGPVVFDGRPRRLIYPADPAIVLPPHLARLIDSDRTVTVAFTVRADGSVRDPRLVHPTAALPAEVREYLRAEFARWRFEQDREDGHARFLYSIKMK
jgi:outer membrane biosynthesis protein TonB